MAKELTDSEAGQLCANAAWFLVQQISEQSVYCAPNSWTLNHSAALVAQRLLDAGIVSEDDVAKLANPVQRMMSQKKSTSPP